MATSVIYTLQKRGELRAPNGNAELQRELDKHIPFEYIIRWLQLREGRAGIGNKFLVIQSGASSGKSTTIPAEIYKAFIRARYVRGGGLVCTQPRIITTVANVHDIAKRFHETFKIGETIGWSTQFSKNRPRRIGLLSATIGVLAMQLDILTDAEIMQLYRFIIIDEVHERSPTADFALASLKRFLARNQTNPACPFVILMSATIDPLKYARYFLDRQGTANTLVDNIIICSAAPPFDRPKFWARGPVTQIIDEIARIIEQIIDKNPAPRDTWDPTTDAAREADFTQVERDDILVFLPGRVEIIAARKAIDRMNTRRDKEGKTVVRAIPLTSHTVKADREAVRNIGFPLRKNNKRHGKDFFERRVILSTNVAETGRTFETLRYVIDAGFNRENEYDPMVRVETLTSKPAPVSRIIQRWGRVGRKFPGEIHNLYTEEIFQKLPREQLPEIAYANLAPFIIQLIFGQQQQKKALGREPYFAAGDLDLLDPIQPDILASAIESAYELGLIARGPPKFSSDLETFLGETERAPASAVGITRLGRLVLELQSSSFDISIEAARTILAGFSWGYSPIDLAAAMAFLVVSRATEEDAGHEIPGKSHSNEISMTAAYTCYFEQPDTDSTGGPMIEWRLLLGDTFFDGVILYAALRRILREFRGVMLLERLTLLANDTNIAFDSIMQFMGTCDAICSTLISLGFDVRGVSLLDTFRSFGPGEELARIILRYKHCIYDGFRQNLVLWDEKSARYRTCTGVPIKDGIIEKIFAQTKPRALIFHRFGGYVDGSAYSVGQAQMSILDGFIGVSSP